MIPHTLFWRLQIDPAGSDYTFNCQKNLVATCCLYLVEPNVQKPNPSVTAFYTQMITYLNRMIVVKPNEFLTILSELLAVKQISINFWVEEYFRKMEHVVSQEGQRINCLAIYNILPHLNGPLIGALLPEVGRLTF